MIVFINPFECDFNITVIKCIIIILFDLEVFFIMHVLDMIFSVSYCVPSWLPDSETLTGGEDARALK